MPKRLLVLNLAALSRWELGADCPHLSALAAKGTVQAMNAPAPALTCSSHATMLTGLSPQEHGVVGNGWFEPTQSKVVNWSRSDQVLSGERIWEAFKVQNPQAQVINLFWRFCSHSSCDLTLTERPTYFANGRKGADVYSSDVEFKREVIKRFGPFPFFHFWGPKAGVASSEWILKVAEYALSTRTPELLLCYAPGLDYDGQRFGPHSLQARDALRKMDQALGELFRVAEAQGYDIAVVSDYGFTEVSRPIALNQVLRQAGYLAIDEAMNGELLEPNASQAFAVCDNQVAHIYIRGAQGWGSEPDQDQLRAIKALLLEQDGVRMVWERGEGPKLWHQRAGSLLVIAEPDAWFSYQYWFDVRRAPDFYQCVDIFNKPGFDPTEMLMRPGIRGIFHVAKRFAQLKLGIRAPFDVISGDPSMIRGARAIMPKTLEEEGAIFISSWKQDVSSDSLDMTELKERFIARLCDGL